MSPHWFMSWAVQGEKNSISWHLEKHLQGHASQTQHTGIRAITQTNNNNESFIALLGQQNPNSEHVRDVEWHNKCKQQSEADGVGLAVLSVVHIYLCALEISVRHPRTWGKSQSWSSLSGTPASGWERGWNVFWLQQVDTSRWKPGSIFPLVFTAALDLLNPCCLIAFSSWATNSPQTAVFIFTTWPIYKTASWWVLLQKRGPSLWSNSRSLTERLSLQL